MAEVTTTRPVNISQLCVEMERIPLRCVDDGSTRRVKTDAVSQGALEAAVSAHVADANWTDPNPPPPTPEAQLQTAMQAARARALEVAADPVNNQFTPVQVQRILAHYVLRVTR